MYDVFLEGSNVVVEETGHITELLSPCIIRDASYARLWNGSGMIIQSRHEVVTLRYHRRIDLKCLQVDIDSYGDWDVRKPGIINNVLFTDPKRMQCKYLVVGSGCKREEMN